MEQVTNNFKYTSYWDIWARLSRVHTNKKFSPSEVVEWASEVETDILGDVEGMHHYMRVPLHVYNLTALLPCNTYRLLDVFTGVDKRIEYSVQGDYIAFSSGQTFSKDEKNHDVVYINYEGIAIGEDGYPLIRKGHELAVEAYCTWKVYYEDFLTGKLDGQRWSFINQQKEQELNAATNGFRHWDNKDLERIHMIKMNMIPKIGKIPLSNLEWDQHLKNQTGI